MFQYPWIFLWIFILVLLWFYIYKSKQDTGYFVAFDQLKSVYKTNSLWYKIYFVLLFCICLLYITILALPIKKEQKQTVNKNGIDIQFILDVSYSMEAQDLQPSRLEVAKTSIISFLDQLVSDRVWLVVFSGRPFSSIPLNFDYKVIESMVERISTDIINQRNTYLQGTAIGDALILAADNLNDGEKREKIIILLTDGTSNKGIYPQLALDFLEENYDFDIKIYSIWIGGDESSIVTIPWVFGQSQMVQIDPLDEKVLKMLSSETWWQYYRVKNKSDLAQVFDDISQLEKTDIEVQQYEISKPNYKLFLYLLALTYLWVLFILYRKKIR